ncbi:hypothetical protein N9024_00090 [bacterium]|nr:hypothetical protein [bacterium]
MRRCVSGLFPAGRRLGSLTNSPLKSSRSPLVDSHGSGIWLRNIGSPAVS